MELLGVFALGFIVGLTYYKYVSGISDIEAEAFVAGYSDGYVDSRDGYQQTDVVWSDYRSINGGSGGK